MADHPAPSGRARELVRGGFDPYVHAAPDFAARRITDLELAERCLELELAGFGLTSHYTATAERAAVVNAAGARPAAVPVFDDRGAPLPQLSAVLEIVARHRLVLMTGHLSREEIFA